MMDRGDRRSAVVGVNSEPQEDIAPDRRELLEEMLAEVIAAHRKPKRAVEAAPDRDAIRVLVREEIAGAMARLEAAARPEGLLTLSEASKLVGLTPSALRARAYRGSIPVVRHGRSLRFRRRDVLK